MKTHRQHDPDDLTPQQRERMCPSCRIRYAHPPKALRDMYNPIALQKGTISWLENAARAFDGESDERFTAHEFIAWLKPDLTGHRPVDHGVPVGGRPVEYDDEKHIKDRERKRRRAA